MKNNLSIITFKWKKNKTGYKLKNQIEYSSDHVNILFRSIKRTTDIKFNFFCITDDPLGLDKEINYIPLWNKHINLGGCYNRLYIFDKEISKLFGDRLLCIDLDCVIVGDISSLLKRTEDFVINKYLGKGNNEQLYNGGLFLMTAGSRQKVWSDFHPVDSLKKLEDLRNQNKVLGSDQAWIQYCLGNNESIFDESDGVYDFSFLKDKRQLPDNAKIIFFPGRPDPSLYRDIDWIQNNWKI